MVLRQQWDNIAGHMKGVHAYSGCRKSWISSEIYNSTDHPPPVIIIIIIICIKKIVPVTGRGGLLGCEMLRIPHCLDSRLTDGGKFVSPTHRPRSTPQKHYFSASCNHFCKRTSEPQGLMWSEGKIGKKFIHLIGSRTRDLPAYTIVP
jgi:hypothetical protein